MPANRLSDGASKKSGSPSARADATPLQVGQIYESLCKVEVLRLAYESLSNDREALDAGKQILDSGKNNAVESFIEELCNDLQARQYHPGGCSHPLSSDASQQVDLLELRDRLVQISVRTVLGPIFEPTFPCDPHPKSAIKWIALAAEGGLAYAYAVNLQRCLKSCRHEQLLRTVIDRTGDAEITALLRQLLEVFPESKTDRQAVLFPMIADIACQGVDRILQQASAIGREGNIAHVKCLRLSHEMIILFDNDSRYEWLLPAVYGKLSKEVGNFNSKIGDADVQSLNLADRQQLSFLGYELRAAPDENRRLRVRYRRIGEAEDEEEELLPPPELVQPPPLLSPSFEVDDSVEDKNPPAAETLRAEPLPSKRRFISRRTLIFTMSAIAASAAFLYYLEPPALVLVEGRVTVAGRPKALANCDFARVWLHPDRDKGNRFPRIPMAEVHKDGSYTVYTDGELGAPPGWYRVAVMANDGRQQVLDLSFSEPASSGLAFHVEADAEPGRYDLSFPGLRRSRD